MNGPSEKLSSAIGEAATPTAVDIRAAENKIDVFKLIASLEYTGIIPFLSILLLKYLLKI